MSMLALGVGGGQRGLAQGVYVIKTAADPTNPVPSSPLWVTATTRLGDGSPGDHTTEEAVSIAGLGTTGTMEFLFVGNSSLWATYVASFRYSTAAPAVTLSYWDGSAWQAWDAPSLPPHISDTFEDISRNPTDRTTSYLLLTVTAIGDSSATDFAVSDWRPST